MNNKVKKRYVWEVSRGGWSDYILATTPEEALKIANTYMKNPPTKVESAKFHVLEARDDTQKALQEEQDCAYWRGYNDALNWTQPTGGVIYGRDAR